MTLYTFLQGINPLLEETVVKILVEISTENTSSWRDKDVLLDLILAGFIEVLEDNLGVYL